ncbi:MAG: hypothetical protein GY898_13765 [Proteobacteria bacterium]|nr:hypothetical protein [Pseudomonadota bacterium]
MRVAFIQKDPMPRPDLMVLGASVTFLGHQASVFIPAAERDLERALRRFAPAVVVFAPPTGFHPWAFGVARRISAITGGAPNVFVGSHATDHPEIAREAGVDLVMVGDPETTLRELLFKIDNERDLPGTTGTVAASPDGTLIEGPARQAMDELDDLPLADLEIYRRYRFVRHQTTLSVCTGRGVMENVHAGFRIGPKELERRFEQAPRHSVTEAIHRVHLHIQRRPHYRRVAFRDDTLLMDGALEPWLGDFLDRYRREVGLPFQCGARSDLLGPEVVRELARAGCDLIRLATDARDHDADAVARLRAAGIHVQTISFLGRPGDGDADSLAELDHVLTLEPEHAFAIACDGTVRPFDERLQRVFPIVVDAPLLKPLALAAVGSGADRLLNKVFQLHHDLSFITSGELAPVDIVRIASRMRRGRREAYAS